MRVAVQARGGDDVQAGRAGDPLEPVEVAAEADRRPVDERAAAGGDERLRLLDRLLDVGELVARLRRRDEEQVLVRVARRRARAGRCRRGRCGRSRRVYTRASWRSGSRPDTPTPTRRSAPGRSASARSSSAQASSPMRSSSSVPTGSDVERVRIEKSA